MPIQGRPAVDADGCEIAALQRRDTWVAGAAVLLEDLGFSLIDSDRPGQIGSHLLIALRARPTLRHFDPEAVGYYTSEGSRARVTRLDRSSSIEPPRVALWGHVHVIDRLRVENRFLTFGGELRVADLDPSTRLVDLRSPGPIVRWGGHSQASDTLAGAIGAFFGRVIVPVDFIAGAEARFAAADPEALYAAFLIDLQARRQRPGRSDDAPASLGLWLASERRRVGAAAPATWDAGAELLSIIRAPAAA